MIRGMEARLGGKMDRVEGKVISLERRMDRGDDDVRKTQCRPFKETGSGIPWG